MNKRKLLALSGTNGSGKDSLGEILAEHHGYWFFSLTELLRQECHKRGIPVIRDNTRLVSEEWRRNFGLAVLVDRSLDEYKKAGGDKKYKGVVMSSLRNPHEADRIHELGGSVIWVDADPKVRYDRIQANAASRGRAGEDNRTFDEFLKEQEDEMHPPAGAGADALNMAAVKERCDLVIENNSSNIETFRKDIEAALGL